MGIVLWGYESRFGFLHEVPMTNLEIAILPD